MEEDSQKAPEDEEDDDEESGSEKEYDVFYNYLDIQEAKQNQKNNLFLDIVKSKNQIAFGQC